jgi:hypothetical protein
MKYKNKNIISSSLLKNLSGLLQTTELMRRNLSHSNKATDKKREKTESEKKRASAFPQTVLNSSMREREKKKCGQAKRL